MELGKPDAGKPPVRFDEGREADGHWHSGPQSVASCLLYTFVMRSTAERRRQILARLEELLLMAGAAHDPALKR
jgi:hypothetical protein